MNSKLPWGEGLLLRPQHFQRQDQYHEHRLLRAGQPDTVPVRPDTCCFVLDAKGQMYERMLQAQAQSVAA